LQDFLEGTSTVTKRSVECEIQCIESGIMKRGDNLREGTT
jgi:hypothetical protein